MISETNGAHRELSNSGLPLRMSRICDNAKQLFSEDIKLIHFNQNAGFYQENFNDQPFTFTFVKNAANMALKSMFKDVIDLITHLLSIFYRDNILKEIFCRSPERFYNKCEAAASIGNIAHVLVLKQIKNVFANTINKVVMVHF